MSIFNAANVVCLKLIMTKANVSPEEKEVLYDDETGNFVWSQNCSRNDVFIWNYHIWLKLKFMLIMLVLMV